MKLPVHVDTRRHRHPSGAPIVDADNVVVARVNNDESASFIAEAINRRMPFWHKLFGPPRDDRQRAYDEWIGVRGGYRGGKIKPRAPTTGSGVPRP